MTYDPERVVRNALLLRGANKDARLAERWRNFPTDEQVEAAANALVAHELGTRVTVQTSGRIARAALEAVALDREDFDRNVGLGGERMDYGPQVRRVALDPKERNDG
jgi:hypothetical protein